MWEKQFLYLVAFPLDGAAPLTAGYRANCCIYLAYLKHLLTYNIKNLP